MARFKNTFNLSAFELDIFKGLRKEYSQLRSRVKDREKRMRTANENLAMDKYLTNLGMIVPDMRTLEQLDNFADITKQSYHAYINSLNESIAEAKEFLANKENSSKTIKALGKSGREASLARFVAGKMGILTLDTKTLEYYAIGFAAIRELSEREQWRYYSDLFAQIDVEALGRAIKNKDHATQLKYTEQTLEKIKAIKDKAGF